MVAVISWWTLLLFPGELWMVVVISKNNTMTKIGDFCPVALSRFMGGNVKEKAQTAHCVCKRKGKQGHPFT